MSRQLWIALLLLSSLLVLAACQKQEEPLKPAPPPAAGTAPAPPPAAGAIPAPPEPPRAPQTGPGGEPLPAPPIHEDFEGEPKLSLFPRAGSFRPEQTDKDGLSIWATYLNHLVRSSGILVNKDQAKGRAFGFRGIKAADSIGFFSPLAVDADKSYRVSVRFWSKLAPGATTGVGVLEYDTFLFVPEQLPRSLHDQHFQRSQLGIKLSGENKGKLQSFSFRTGPKTRMIHLIFFREGTPDREPVIIDDIDIRAE